MAKHWDYEDDHDWDDDVDYAAKGYVYWYGKYVPREQVESLYPPEIDGRKVLGLLGAVGGVIFAIVGAVKWRNSSAD